MVMFDIKSWSLLLKPRIFPSSCIFATSSPSLVEETTYGNVNRLNFLLESRSFIFYDALLDLMVYDALPELVFDWFPLSEFLNLSCKDIFDCYLEF